MSLQSHPYTYTIFCLSNGIIINVPLKNLGGILILVQGQESLSQARSILAYTPDDTEEIIDTNEPIEDVVVTDYAQPHRKPPIHNREP